ncbi:hypothetical protein B9Z55_018030 [Caenorhabditis nigoni]|uniref:Activin types I and II receptor domain-containing protein n=1 Tax=Caenorhabditis nigoni TaxID=1611254 RepID=A0A2G5TCF7_9PELO|nr:hypothetical protein B9Z55_018030 [Caenorhabditis nigoni]
MCESGSYCFTTWIVAHGAIKEQGCKTTRTDLTDRQCQTNRKGLVTCVCSSEKCNDASFSIPSDIALTAPPVIKCYSYSMKDDDFCFGHYCTYTAQTVMNDFGDVFKSSYGIQRGCSDAVYADDVDSTNICYAIDNSIICQCNTEFCNRDQSLQVPLGNLLCYFGHATNPIPDALNYCRGHLCYKMAPDYNGKITRGCLSVSDGAPAELKLPGASKIACPEECDAGTYCYTTWIVLGGDVVWQGCKTTRTDLLRNYQCQTNRKGLVTCVCNSEKCNGASFSVPSDAALSVPKTIKCFNMDLNQDNFCFGHYCTYSMEMIINDFGDLIPTGIRVYRGCSDVEWFNGRISLLRATLHKFGIEKKCERKREREKRRRENGKDEKAETKGGTKGGGNTEF